jgi:hypothetical protein
MALEVEGFVCLYYHTQEERTLTLVGPTDLTSQLIGPFCYR